MEGMCVSSPCVTWMWSKANAFSGPWTKLLYHYFQLSLPRYTIGRGYLYCVVQITNHSNSNIHVFFSLFRSHCYIGAPNSILEHCTYLTLKYTQIHKAPGRYTATVATSVIDESCIFYWDGISHTKEEYINQRRANRLV